MPDHPTWLERIPLMLQSLQAENAPPFLDRAAIETLFGVRRRQAISLLHSFDGYQLGRALVAKRESVMAFLERRNDGGAIAAAEAQKQRVADALGEARHALALPRISLPPPSKLSKITFTGLPPGIRLVPGQLAVEFQTATDLLEKLFSLAQAFANDFEGLEQALAGAAQKGAAHAKR